MTIERKSRKKLKNFLKENFPRSSVRDDRSDRDDLGPRPIKSLIESLLEGRDFRMEIFDIRMKPKADTMNQIKRFCEYYYVERDWLVVEENILVPKPESGVNKPRTDLSFERDHELLFLIILQFEKFFQVMTVRFKNPDWKGINRCT